MAKDTDRAKGQALAQYQSIVAMVKELQKCDKLRNTNPSNESAWGAAEQAIHEDPLSVMVRDGWRQPGAQAEDGPEEYEILLCTGGPAVRLVGELDGYCQPKTARLEYQDWGTPWTHWVTRGDYSKVEANLLAYAQCFYFGE